MSADIEVIDGLPERLDAMEAMIADLRGSTEMAGRKAAGDILGPLPRGPVRKSGQVLDSGSDGYQHRLLVGTASTGTVRMEWVDGRFHQIVPPNWAMVEMVQYVNGYVPMRYQVADAQNLIVAAFMAQQFEWLFLLEHDVILPHGALLLLDRYMMGEKIPVVSGLYYTRSRPSEPLIYRGRGTRFFDDWEFGDLVWADGVPTGCLLIHRSIIAGLWEESEEYIIQHPDGRRDVTRKVFDVPRFEWYDPESAEYQMLTGTSDLAWCTRIIEAGILEKAGWPEIAAKPFPFLVDTRLFCPHINPNGEQFP